jgi:hypothetical protein
LGIQYNTNHKMQFVMIIGTRVPPLGSLLRQRNTSPTCQFSCIALIVIIIILKY